MSVVAFVVMDVARLMAMLVRMVVGRTVVTGVIMLWTVPVQQHM